jgi:hypothetical protein
MALSFASCAKMAIEGSANLCSNGRLVAKDEGKGKSEQGTG